MNKLAKGVIGLIGALVAFTVIAYGDSARAAPILFSTRAAWNAAVPGASTIDFETPSTPSSFTYFGSGGSALYSASGVDFTVSNVENLYTVGPGYHPAYGVTQVLSSQLGSVTNNIVVTLPGLFNAVALDFNTIFAASAVTFTLSNGDIFGSLSVTGQPLSFIGEVSSTPFSSLVISTIDSTGLNIDNFSFGTAATTAAVPEPSSLAFLGAGLLSLILLRRRRHPLKLGVV